MERSFSTLLSVQSLTLILNSSTRLKRTLRVNSGKQHPIRHPIRSQNLLKMQFLSSRLVALCCKHAVAGVVLNKAVRDRMQRNEQDALLKQLQEKPEETEEDWMEKFNKPSTQPTVPESPAMSPEAFTRAFNHNPILSACDDALIRTIRDPR